MVAVNTNIASLMSSNYSRLNRVEFGEKVERISSGYRINRGADDPSGLAISSGMMSHIRGVNSSISNALDDLNLLRTADAVLGDLQSILLKMRDLSVRLANEAAEYAKNQGDPSSPKPPLFSEAQQLHKEIELFKDHIYNSFKIEEGGTPYRISTALINYNRKNLFDTTGVLSGQGFGNKGQTAQIGPDNEASQQLQIIFNDIAEVMMSFSTPYDPPLPADSSPLSWYVDYAKFRIEDMDAKLSMVSDVRIQIGTWDMRIQHVLDDLQADYISTSAANSMLRDANMAVEIVALTQNQLRRQTEQMIATQINSEALITMPLLDGIYNGLMTNQ